MRKLIVIFSLLAFAACKQTAEINPIGNGQFYRYYGNGVLRDAIPTIPEGRTLCLASDNSIIGVGTVATRSFGDSIISQAYLFKLDDKGLLTKDILIGTNYITRAVDITTAADGSHYLLLNIVYSQQKADSIMQVIKISDGLNISWTKTFSSDSVIQTQNQGRAISVDDGGNLILLGNYYPGGAGISKMFTARMNPDNGNVIWKDSLGVNNRSNPVGKTISVYMSSNQRYAWCGNDLNKAFLKPKLIVTDEDGNIWQNNGIESSDENTSDNESGSELIRTDNGTFLIVGTLSESDKSTTQMRLLRVSGQGQLLWSQTFGGDLNETGISVCEAPDKGFLILGTTDSYGNGNSDIFLVKTDNAGDMLWQKTYGGPENDVASKIISVDGGYAIIGTASVAGTRLITVIKTDLEGNTL